MALVPGRQDQNKPRWGDRSQNATSNILVVTGSSPPDIPHPHAFSPTLPSKPAKNPYSSGTQSPDSLRLSSFLRSARSTRHWGLEVRSEPLWTGGLRARYFCYPHFPDEMEDACNGQIPQPVGV